MPLAIMGSEVKLAIVQKLQDELTSQIERESQVVYILVEVRKLLEISNLKDQYVVLQFFCDWALHTKLRKRNAGLLLRPFDKAYGNRTSDGFLRPEDQEALGRMVSLVEFSRELNEVFDVHGITPKTLRGSTVWLRFIELYLSIIKDCPLEYNAKEIELKHINGVVVEQYDVSTHIQEMEPTLYMPYGIDWRFLFNGKPVFHWPMPFAIDKPVPAAAR